jgi:DNA-binding beta-propeller fold protein YncE
VTRLAPRWAILAAVCACEACGSSSSAQVPASDAAVDTEAGAALDAGADATGAVDAAPVDCTVPGLPPLRSCDLAAWPASAPVVAADLTTSSGVTSASLTGKPFGLELSKDGAWLFVASGSGTTSAGNIAVYRRQGATATFDHAVALPPGNPTGIRLSHDGQTLAVCVSDQVAFFDTTKVQTGAAGALLGTAPTRSVKKTTIDVVFSADDRFVFTSLEYDAQVVVLDRATRSFVGAVPIGGDAITALALSPNGARLYVVAEAASEWRAHNPGGPKATDQVVGSVTVVDVARAETDAAHGELGHVFTGRAPVRIALSPDGNTAWVTARGSNEVVAIDTTKMLDDPEHALLGKVAVGPAPVGLAVVDHGTGLLVANSNRFLQPMANQTAMLVSVRGVAGGAPMMVLGQVAVGAFPRDLVADDTAAFLSNFNSGSVSGFDLSRLPAP